MPGIEGGRIVEFTEQEVCRFCYPPPKPDKLVVAVEGAAVRKARGNALTTVMSVDDDDTITWVGSVDESLLEVIQGSFPDARQLLTQLVLKGKALWQVIRPGPLRRGRECRADTV